MPRRVKAVSHEDRLSLVEHLDELRSRIVVCVGGLRRRPRRSASGRITCCSRSPPARLPGDRKELITFGVTEPFTTTLTVAAYGAIDALAADPPLPALRLRPARLQPPRSDGSCCRSCCSFPVLFRPGSPSPTSSVMPAAVNFLLNFNDSQFNIQVRARDYYSFFSTTMLAGGLVFQLPLAIIAIVRLGIVRIDQLTSNRRYAYLVIAILAAALPGVDPVSMVIEMVPLLVLYRVEYLAREGFRQAGRFAAEWPSPPLRSREELDGWRRQRATGCCSTSGDGVETSSRSSTRFSPS